MGIVQANRASQGATPAGHPPDAARFPRALDRADGSENKARQEVDGSVCRRARMGIEQEAVFLQALRAPQYCGSGLRRGDAYWLARSGGAKRRSGWPTMPISFACRPDG